MGTALPLVAGLGVRVGGQATPGGPALLWLAASPPVPTPGWRLGLQGACSRVTQTACGVPRQLFQKTVSRAAETHSFLLEWVLRPGWLRVGH